MRVRRVASALGAAVLVLLASAGCSVKRVDEAHVGVGYTQGPIEGEKFDGVIEPGGSRTVFDDKVYKLPARQITYIAGNKANGERCDECDRGSFQFTAKGGVQMNLDLATRSFLNRREAALKPFFLEICQKHDCWTDEGWVKMLNETFGNPLEAVVKDVGLEFDAEQLRYNNETKDAFARRIGEEFVESQDRLIGRGDYFCGPGYRFKETNKKADGFCPDPSVEVTSISFANPDREQVHEREELAKAQEALAQQELKTAQAQQATNAAKATPQNLDLMERQAMLDCARNPECQLTIIVGASGEVTVPAG